MKLKIKDLIKKLELQPDQNQEIEYLVYGSKDGEIITMSMEGVDTMKIVSILAKRKK